ncbi:MAG: hypothetical protein JWN52_5937 [Actinomycetia bacterium]|nr:hypothetical protein [Actinomycetes bacterium]
MNDVLWITTRRVPGLAHDTHAYGEERAFHAFWFATALEDRKIPENSLTLVLGHTRHTGAGKGAAETHACTGPPGARDFDSRSGRHYRSTPPPSTRETEKTG